jgi:nucleotidyltransferase/DNA polymerase involved in DNA repair
VNQEQEATGPGIVVLSPSLQVLHMNRRAMALLNQLEHTAQSIGTERAVAAPLHQHCQDIIETLRERLAANNWEQFRQYRTIGDSSRTILLKGFGIPDRRGLPHSRIVMLLSPHTPAPMPEIRKRESLNGISKDSQLGADSPRATSTHHA